MKKKPTIKNATLSLATFLLAFIGLFFNQKIALAALPTLQTNFDTLLTTSTSTNNIDYSYGTTYSGDIFDFTTALKVSEDDNPSNAYRVTKLKINSDTYTPYLANDCNANSQDLFFVNESIVQVDTIEFPYYKINDAGNCIDASTTPIHVNLGDNLGFRVYYYYSTISLYGNSTGKPFTAFNTGHLTNIAEIIETETLTTPNFECSSIDIACHIKKGFVWLFYPSQNSVDQFSGLSLQEKFPFSYAYDIETLRGELFPTASSTFAISVPFGSFGTTTLLSTSMIEAVPYASTIKTILSYLLWIGFAELCYIQILKSHNKEV